MERKTRRWPLARRAGHHASHCRRRAGAHARLLARGGRSTGAGSQQRREENPQAFAKMIFPAVDRAIFSAVALSLGLGASLFAHQPFQFPTANHALYEIGDELKFFAPTAPDKPWTTGSFGCVRSDGRQMHEGLDIKCLQRDRHGEPTDPILATADGGVAYINDRPSFSNYGRYIVLRHQIDGIEIDSLYAHLSEVQSGLRAGQPVRAGQPIGI